MITVGIRNLKNSLSQYLKLVKGGERIIITDHNRIVAEIIPAAKAEEANKLMEEYLDDQIETGKITPALKKSVLGRERKEKEIPNQKEIEKNYEQTRADR